MRMGGRETSTHFLIVDSAPIDTVIVEGDTKRQEGSHVQNRDKTKTNMRMDGRETSTHRLIVDSAPITTVIVEGDTKRQ